MSTHSAIVWIFDPHTEAYASIKELVRRKFDQAKEFLAGSQVPIPATHGLAGPPTQAELLPAVETQETGS